MTSRILVVDDEDAILELFRIVLEDVGYEVIVSKVVFKEIRDVEQIQPALIILDLMFGTYQTGWDFLHQLQIHPSTKAIPVILCTAAILEVGKREHELQQKGVTVVRKPFDLDELLQVVRRFLPAPSTPT